MITTYLYRLLRRNKEKKSLFHEWTYAILFAIVMATLVRWGAAETFTIPSSSMEKSLMTGDFIVVSKLHYGPRLPITPLQVPLTHQKIWGTNIPSFLSWIKLPYLRLPGFSSVHRGDVVVFNKPEERDKPIDLKTYYIKRCVALPGDEIHIHNKAVYVNGNELPHYEGLQYRYFLQTTEILSDRFFKAYEITEYLRRPGGYQVHTTPDTIKILTSLNKFQSITPLELQQGEFDQSVYPYAVELGWNEDHYGPIVVPAKGNRISINRENLIRYGEVIRWFEGHREVEIKDERLFIRNKEVTEYVFKQDYYFMMGDNRCNSLDSRYGGFIPIDHILGRAIMVVFSHDVRKPLTDQGKFRIKRVMRPIYRDR